MRPRWSTPSYTARGETPAVYVLLAIMAIVFLMDWLMHGVVTGLLWWPLTPNWFGSLLYWQPFTYQFAHGTSFFGFLADALVLFFFGGSLERAWGSGRFLFFFFACGIVAGLSAMALVPILHVYPVFYSMLATFAAMVVAFATLDPRATVLFSMFIPIQARWLAVFSIAWQIFGMTGIYGSPATAVASVGITSLFAYYFTASRISFGSLFGRGAPSMRERMERWRQKRRWREWQRRVSRVERPEDLFKDNKK
ncbi:MAG: rhomboid family intramembrane serine protease [Candidatus Eremiobacteraeota bacterium]|nr:rhomboid family intramembrane serine protease [Candidatus Eremiobacteraeota bacterium]MBV8595535.1 rhomboid family intramembrane serine protease [Candidatus Eremiobacteraeota bacterium]